MAQTSGNKLQGPETKPIKTCRDAGSVDVGDLPLRIVENTGTKLEQFFDIILDYKWTHLDEFFDTIIYKHCAQGDYHNLPEPFSLKSDLPVPILMQIVIVPTTPVENADPQAKYVNIVKHIYLHKNKLPISMCVESCRGVTHKWDYGKHFRVGLLAMNYMLDMMGGMQVRHWVIQPKFSKKQTLDTQARTEGYRFIREKGPRSNNRNQFMEWTDEHIHTAGSPIEGWQEGKVVTALQNYMRGRQNAKTLEYWPFTLKSLKAWFFNGVLVHMLGSIRQHAITWLGKTRTGKSLASKTILFVQSKFEIQQNQLEEELIPSIVTAKHLDFFKAEPLTKFKPGAFDDGQMQKNDASFLKAFLNPAVPQLYL